MRAHELDVDGFIVNTVVVDRLGDGQLDADRFGGGIGDQIVSGVLVPRQPALVEAAPPLIVTMRQAQRALLEVGLLSEVDAAIAAIPDEAVRAQAQVEWRTARDVERHNPFTQLMAGAIGLGENELDELFRIAAAL